MPKLPLIWTGWSDLPLVEGDETWLGLSTLTWNVLSFIWLLYLTCYACALWEQREQVGPIMILFCLIPSGALPAKSVQNNKLSCQMLLTQPIFRNLITFRGIDPPLANLALCSMWSPVNRTYQTKYLIRTRPAAKDKGLRGWLRTLWLQT